MGRGSQDGICLLMKSENISETALSRLRILTDTADGFEIARKDLELRGHGELTGMRQAGMGELDVSEMIREHTLLLDAQKEAERLIADDPDLERPEQRHLKVIMESILAKPLDL